jgi:hypothetical protein
MERNESTEKDDADSGIYDTAALSPKWKNGFYRCI